MKPLTLWLRTGFLLLFFAFASLLAGCVYLRLLQFKSQLADFDKHFSVDSSDGIRVIDKDPILLGDDLRWLGAEPETIRRTPALERWSIHWLKELPPGATEAGHYDIELHADFSDRRLRSVHIPERYFTFVPKALFLEALRSAGHAKIDRQNRQALMDTSGLGSEAPPAAVDLGSIEKMLGIPTERLLEPAPARLRYVFLPQTSAGAGKPIELVFIFDPKSGNLERVIGRLPKGTLNFQFSDSTPAKP